MAVILFHNTIRQSQNKFTELHEDAPNEGNILQIAKVEAWTVIVTKLSTDNETHGGHRQSCTQTAARICQMQNTSCSVLSDSLSNFQIQVSLELYKKMKLSRY